MTRDFKNKTVNFLLMALAASAPLFARSPNVTKYLLILLVIAWIVRGDVSFKIPVALPLFLYVFTVLVSAAVGINPSESFRYFARHTVNLIMIFVVADCIRDKKTFNTVVKIFLISASAVCVLGLLQYAAAKWIFLKKPLAALGVHGLMDGRICSTRRHPVTFADNIALYLPIMAAYAAYRKKFIIITAVAVMLIAIVLTYSRSAIVATGFVVIVALILFYKQTKLLMIPLCVSLIFIVLFVVAFKGMPLKKRMNFDPAGRTYGWRAASDLIRQKPLFGVGIGNVSEWYQQTDEWKKIRLAHLHNTYIQIQVASGVFASLTFFWLLATLLKECIEKQKKFSTKEIEKFIFSGIILGFIALLLAGMTADIFCRAEEYYPIYFFMGITLARVFRRVPV